MRCTRFALAVALALLCVGCGPPRFDASTDESAKASMQAMTSGMSEADKQSFASDCMALALPGMMRGMVVRPGTAPPKMGPAKIFAPLNGMTAAEIRAKGEAAKAAHKRPAR